ncbi:MAG: cytidine deaminase [Alphaproteobacteria bacterium]|nr:cytidine deaminase [Alphaproteobacteria bacterium]
MSDEALLQLAAEARERAHAPYSGFLVGAAVLDAQGRAFTGCNVEISSYSHTCCAERVAVFKAVSEGCAELVAVAVVTDVSPPATPCGACRQVLHDFGPGMRVILGNTEGEVSVRSLRELLPDAFEPHQVLAKIRARHGLDGR